MSWEVIKREDKFEGSDRPFISFSPAHIAFNGMFARVAEITSRHRVTVYADASSRRLGFEFHTDDRLSSLALSQASAAKKGEKRAGVFCAAQGVMNRHAWVKGITTFPPKDRRFYSEITSNAVGIYRYVRENGEIVYIGRGEIKKRLASPDRQDWDFDVVEYSVINNPDEQVRWEDYWLKKFQIANDKLPFYNKVSGFSKT